jgi:hypothetical protein
MRFPRLSRRRRTVGRLICWFRGYHLWHGGSFADMQCLQCDARRDLKRDVPLAGQGKETP